MAKWNKGWVEWERRKSLAQLESVFNEAVESDFKNSAGDQGSYSTISQPVQWSSTSTVLVEMHAG